jgi:hypothetical protein
MCDLRNVKTHLKHNAKTHVTTHRSMGRSPLNKASAFFARQSVMKSNQDETGATTFCQLTISPTASKETHIDQT